MPCCIRWNFWTRTLFLRRKELKWLNNCAVILFRLPTLSIKGSDGFRSNTRGESSLVVLQQSLAITSRMGRHFERKICCYRNVTDHRCSFRRKEECRVRYISIKAQGRATTIHGALNKWLANDLRDLRSRSNTHKSIFHRLAASKGDKFTSFWTLAPCYLPFDFSYINGLMMHSNEGAWIVWAASDRERSRKSELSKSVCIVEISVW